MSDPRDNSTAPASGSTRMGSITIVAIVVLILAAVAVVIVVATGSSSTKDLIPMKVLGGPVDASGQLLVINVTAQRTLQLTGIDPSTQTPTWQTPYSASEITLGQTFNPVSINGVAIDLAPTGAAGDPTVQVKGVDVASGNVAWTANVTGVVSDAPATCINDQYFCFSFKPVGTSTYGAGLMEISAANGSVLRVIPNSQRALGTNLYETTATTPAVMQISSAGTVLWTKSQASIFGELAHNSSGGWNIDVIGSMNVGSLGLTSTTSGYDMSHFSTTGFPVATGVPSWSTQGMYNCMGSLEFLTSPVICKANGTVSAPTGNAAPDFSKVTLTLEGFNADSGAITWSQPVTNVEPLLINKGVILYDGNHIVVSVDGNARVLDTSNGSLARPGTGQLFWCASNPDLAVIAPPGFSAGNFRTASNHYTPCSVSGTTSSTTPQQQPAQVGVTLNGKFFWPTSGGIAYTTAAK